MHLLLIVQPIDRLIHVDSEANEDVHAHKHTDNIKRDEVQEYPFGADNLHIHFSCDHPVINDCQFEEYKVGVWKVVEVVESPYIWRRIIVSYCLIFEIYLAAKEYHAYKGIKVENAEHH
jgi:hypothetical protein